MHRYGYTDNKRSVSQRLNRIEGQVRGVSRMVEEDKYCIDVLTQIKAVQAGLDKVALEVLRDHTRHCLMNDEVESPYGKDKVDELITAVSRMLPR